MSKKQFSVRFWGTRGAVFSPSRKSIKYGGNTACVEVQCGDRLLVLDGGSGLRPLGVDLQKRGIEDFDLLFTHFHYDHICGLPFFAPMFNPNCSIRLWSGHLDRKDATRQSIKEYMVHPFFPVGPEVFNASITYEDFSAGDALDLSPDIAITTCRLNHPDGATGYRFDFDGRSFCYITDTEHRSGELDQNIVSLVKDADVMIYDATYSDLEYPNYSDFGHSTWQEGIRICKAAGVKKYGLFHHRPSRTDAKLDSIVKTAKKRFPGTFAAADGLKIRI